MTGFGRLGLNRLWQEQVIGRWNRTPGYLKWLGGLLLGIFARYLVAHLFPEHWERLSRPLIEPQMPVWLAVIGVIVVLILERAIPGIYREVRAQPPQPRLRPLFGVVWSVPPDVDEVRGPFCPTDSSPLRGTLWTGDFSPTMWICPTCGRQYATPEFPDIRREVERQLNAGMLRVK